MNLQQFIQDGQHGTPTDSGYLVRKSLGISCICFLVARVIMAK